MSVAGSRHRRKRANDYNRHMPLPAGRARDVCLQLQDAILQHRLRPGSKLSEDEVGEIFGVGRTVVRTALQALAHSQLVTIEPHRGAFVASPSPQEAAEIFEARSLIEPRVASLAAKNASDIDIRRLKAHLAEEHTALSENDIGMALALSGRFHIALCDIAGHEVLGAFVQSLISRSSLIIALYWRRRETACESHSHAALVEALAAHDASAADDIMKSHIIDLHSGLDLSRRDEPDAVLADVLAVKPVARSHARAAHSKAAYVETD